MKLSTRIFMAVLIVVFDLLMFVIPLGSIFLAYVIVTRPRWFWDWIVYELYGEGHN